MDSSNRNLKTIDSTTQSNLHWVHPSVLLFVRYAVVRPLLFATWTITHIILHILNINFLQRVNIWLDSWRNTDLTLLTSTEKFDKLPKHLVIAVHEFDPNLKDLEKLCQVVAWAWISKVPVISLYDPEGVIQSNANKIFPALKKALKKECDNLLASKISSGRSAPKVRFVNVGNDEDFSLKDNRINETDETLSIFIFSEKDCKASVVDAAKDIFERRSNAKPTHSLPEALLYRSVDANTLNDAINRRIGWPEAGMQANSEPDLMMVFGNVKSTLGFLPWHIRLTEIHWLPPLEYARLNDFVNSLKKYSRCEQRVGK